MDSSASEREERWSMSTRSTCARTETSSMETGSSQISPSGLRTSAAASAHPLALAARQLVQVAVGEALGRQPYSRHRRLHAGVVLALRAYGDR
jgi:hypothetical protein